MSCIAPWQFCTHTRMSLAPGSRETPQFRFEAELGPSRLGHTLGPFLHRQRIPDAHREVAGAGDQAGAVGAPGDGVDIVAVPAQLGDFLTGGDVEQADGVVTAACGQPRAVGAERHAVDNTPDLDDGELLVGLDVPEADGLIAGARGQQFAVGAEGNPEDVAGVAAGVQLLLGWEIRACPW